MRGARGCWSTSVHFDQTPYTSETLVALARKRTRFTTYQYASFDHRNRPTRLSEPAGGELGLARLTHLPPIVADPMEQWLCSMKMWPDGQTMDRMGAHPSKLRRYVSQSTHRTRNRTNTSVALRNSTTRISWVRTGLANLDRTICLRDSRADARKTRSIMHTQRPSVVVDSLSFSQSLSGL